MTRFNVSCMLQNFSQCITAAKAIANLRRKKKPIAVWLLFDKKSLISTYKNIENDRKSTGISLTLYGVAVKLCLRI